MKLDKSCKTCEFSNGVVCMDIFYGEEIVDFNIQRDCWNISMTYFSELLNMLSDEDKAYYVHKNIFDIDNIVRKINTGSWT